jgi:hypothetical protein
MARLAAEALGDTAILSGGGNIVVRGGEVTGVDVEVKDRSLTVISAEQAIDRIGAVARFTLEQLQRNIEQAREQSSQFFRLTLVFSGIGAAVVLLGVVLLFLGQVTAGVVASAASLIPDVSAAMFFRQDRRLRQTIETYHKHMLDSQRLLTMVDVAATVGNAHDRDRIKREIILKMLAPERP